MASSSVSGGVEDAAPHVYSGNDRSPGHHKKLKRNISRSGATYPRKRAIIACDVCRRRKIKCDNERPTCGGCKDIGIQCIYRDTKLEHSTYDLASLEILERINYVAGLLENQKEVLLEHTRPSHAVVSPCNTYSNWNQTFSQFQSIPVSLSYSERLSTGNTSEDAENLLESLKITEWKPGSSEDVLDWPIFRGRYDRAKIEALIFDPSLSHNSGVPGNLTTHCTRQPRAGQGVHEDDILDLIDQFLINVHVKNPILDPNDLIQKGRSIVANGFSWNADSCLVLIVGALGRLSSRFTPEPVTPNLVNEDTAPSSISDEPHYSTAENYYAAAQKRFGLLDNSIQTVQCYFLAGVYEMYSLRPIKAWTSFNQACTNLVLILRSSPQRQFTSASRGLEHILYWACIKSECELRMEVNLPLSGLTQINYPDVFPTPPGESVQIMDDLSASRSRSNHDLRLELDQERIWVYYLSEIAVRKIGNRVMHCFYRDDEASWLSMPLERMMRVADELELQLAQWFKNVPSSLAGKETSGQLNQIVTDELKFVLYARRSDLRERIYRPFLYLAIHYPRKDPIQQVLAPYVQKLVDACLSFLSRGTLRHRHHGTWYENRAMFLKSILLIAAVKSNKIDVPDTWRQSVDSCVSGLIYWEKEAPDLHESRLVLQELLVNL